MSYLSSMKFDKGFFKFMTKLLLDKLSNSTYNIILRVSTSSHMIHSHCGMYSTIAFTFVQTGGLMNYFGQTRDSRVDLHRFESFQQ